MATAPIAKTRQMTRSLFILCVVAALGACDSKPEEPTGKELRRFRIQLDFGRDSGQSFGTVFELTDRNGRVIAGAGFTDVYNTYFRNDRHKLQFYIKPVEHPDAFTIERVPHRAKYTGTYLIDQGNTLYAWTDPRGRPLIKKFLANSNRLVDSNEFGNNKLVTGSGVMQVEGKQLSFLSGGVEYDKAVVIKAPKHLEYYNFYYAAGHIFFYRKGEWTRVYAVKWKPGDTIPIDISNSPHVNTTYKRTLTFSWGQHEDRVVTVGSYGGVYAFGDGAWTTDLEGSEHNYQVYSMMNFDGRSYMAHYPTGNLLQYDRGTPRRMVDWPPVIGGALPDGREAQTLGIYRGDLIVGVWPWAEIWRLEKGATHWKSMGRGFSHPELSPDSGRELFERFHLKKTGYWIALVCLVVGLAMRDLGRRRKLFGLRCAAAAPMVAAVSVAIFTYIYKANPDHRVAHPYEEHAVQHGLDFNHWGQRITGMINIGEYLYLSTSSKRPGSWKDEYDFLDETKRQEYGAILRMHMTGTLTVPVKWIEGGTVVEVRVHDDHFIMLQDGKELGRSTISPATARQVVAAKAQLGQGVFGPSGVANLKWDPE